MFHELIDEACSIDAMNTYDCIQNFLTIILSSPVYLGLVGLVGLVIAFIQLNNNRKNKPDDLYEKRFEVYKAFKAFIDSLHFMQDAKHAEAILMEAQKNFMPVEFIFSKDMNKVIKEAYQIYHRVKQLTMKLNQIDNIIGDTCISVHDTKQGKILLDDLMKEYDNIDRLYKKSMPIFKKYLRSK